MSNDNLYRMFLGLSFISLFTYFFYPIEFVENCYGKQQNGECIKGILCCDQNFIMIVHKGKQLCVVDRTINQIFERQLEVFFIILIDYSKSIPYIKGEIYLFGFKKGLQPSLLLPLSQFLYTQVFGYSKSNLHDILNDVYFQEQLNFRYITPKDLPQYYQIQSLNTSDDSEYFIYSIEQRIGYYCQTKLLFKHYLYNIILILASFIVLVILYYKLKRTIKQYKLARMVFDDWKSTLELSDGYLQIKDRKRIVRNKHGNIVDDQFWRYVDGMRKEANIQKGQDYWIYE